MRRWHEERAVMARRARVVSGDRERQPVALGELRKRPALGCPRARCGLCHPSKRWHRQGDRALAERQWRRDWDA